MRVRVVCRDRKAERISYLAINWQSTRRYYLTVREADAGLFPDKESADLAFASFLRGYGKLVYQACYHTPVCMDCMEAVS